MDRSKDKPEDIRSAYTSSNAMVGSMGGSIQDLEVESDTSSDEESDEDDVGNNNTNATKTNSSTSKKSVFSMFSKFVGAKNLSREEMEPALDKLRDHLISKNVANYIANELCDSVAAKLEGKVLGTFDTIASTVKAALNEALVQILSPKRRVDILRDCVEAKKNQRPFVMTFCGVNGVGKSTNLAKICFWLIENNFNVLIAACDTFRAGAVEQLRTHMRHLNALHPPEKHNGRQMVQLYEKGYGKDAAGIAMEAIRFAKDSRIDVVLVDTAGRMQDNEPLMRALTKLITVCLFRNFSHITPLILFVFNFIFFIVSYFNFMSSSEQVNEPDLVLFVGEALVGNEAVDQLTKFNQALADHSSSASPHLIDGIVLTKFDTIDDKVSFQ